MGGMGGSMPSMGGGGGKKGENHKKKDTLHDNMEKFSPKGLPQASPSSYHKGGTVKKSGVAKVKKGEEVLTPREAKEYP